MQDTTDTMFVNKKLSEYIHFVQSQHETQDKCSLRGVLWLKPVAHPSRWGILGGQGGVTSFCHSTLLKIHLSYVLWWELDKMKIFW